MLIGKLPPYDLDLMKGSLQEDLFTMSHGVSAITDYKSVEWHAGEQGHRDVAERQIRFARHQN